MHNGRVSKKINSSTTFGGKGLQSKGAGRGKKESVYNVFGKTYMHKDGLVEDGIDLNSSKKITIDTSNGNVSKPELRIISRATWSTELDQLLLDIYNGTDKLKHNTTDWGTLHGSGVIALTLKLTCIITIINS